MTQAVEEGIEIHLLREVRLGSRFLRRPAPVPGHIFPVVSCAASGMGGMGDGTEGLQPSVRGDQVICVKTAERMVAAGGHEALDRDPGLLADVRHQLVQGVPILCLRHARIASEVRHWLEVDSPDPRGQRHREPYQLAQVVVIDTFDYRRHQCHADPEPGAYLDGLPLCLQQRCAAQRLIDILPGPVELEKDDVQPSFPEPFGKIRILCKADSVGVHLGVAAAGLFRIADQLRKIVPQGRFSAGKLQQRTTALGRELSDGLLHLLERRILCALSAVGKAEATVQIAALRHLQQRAAGPDLMLRADAAGFRTAQAATFRQRLCSKKPLVEVQLSAPDRYAKSAVLWALLFQQDRPVRLPRQPGRQVLPANRAHRACLPYFFSHFSSLPDCFH